MAFHFMASESSCETGEDDKVGAETAADHALRRTRPWTSVPVHEGRPVADVESVVSDSMLIIINRIPWPKSREQHLH